MAINTEKALLHFRDNLYKTMRKLEIESKGNMALTSVFVAFVRIIENLDSAINSAKSTRIPKLAIGVEKVLPLLKKFQHMEKGLSIPGHETADYEEVTALIKEMEEE